MEKSLESRDEAEVPTHFTTETESTGHKIREQFSRKFLQRKKKLLKTFRKAKLYEDIMVYI